MEADDSSAAPSGARFELTRWSVVLEAAQSRAPGGPKALAQLCARYWQPLYGFARGRGYGHEDAQDLVQGFFADLIERRALHSVERSKGRFRSFLLASFQNFMAKETRRARTEKRGGRVELVRLDWEDEEGRVAFEPSDQLTPETLYDAHWAVLLLRRATRRLEQEQAAAGKGEAFSALKSFLGEDGSRSKISYAGAGRSGLACQPSRPSFTGYARGTGNSYARRSSALCRIRSRSTPRSTRSAKRSLPPRAAFGYKAAAAPAAFSHRMN